MAKQLLQSLEQVADIAPIFLEKKYVLAITSPTTFTLTHEKNGMRFNSTELRPNGRDFVEQFQEAVGKRRGQNQAGPSLPDSGIEMQSCLVL